MIQSSKTKQNLQQQKVCMLMQFDLNFNKQRLENLNKNKEMHKQQTVVKQINLLKQNSNSKGAYQSKRFYTLPKKAQPTNSSSQKINRHSTAKIQYVQVETCPQVSSFQVNSKQNIDYIYTHKLRLDYGRLQKPKYYMQKQVNKQLQLSHQLSTFIQTKQLKNIKALCEQQNETNQVKTNKKIKKGLIKSIQKLNPQSQLKIKKNCPQSQIKTQSKNKIFKINVKAYDYINNAQLQKYKQNQKMTRVQSTLNQHHFQDSYIKKLNNNDLNNENHQQMYTQKLNTTLRTSRVSQSSRTHTQKSDSQRKILHSRIVKMVNPSSGMQTKIICYPDLSELKRIKKIL